MSLMSTLWSWGFVVFAVCCGYVSVMQLLRSQARAAIPQLLFLKVSNEIQLETDLTFVRQ